MYGRQTKTNKKGSPKEFGVQPLDMNLLSQC